MVRHAVIGVSDDLASGQAAVVHRPADHELADRVEHTAQVSPSKLTSEEV